MSVPEAEDLTIFSPMSGWCGPLEEVSDPVFAGRLAGDGVTVDPTEGSLHAPCDGEIVMLPATAHAISIRTACGIEVLAHIGIDTVGLGGAGFTACVQAGAHVRRGDLLIRFDLDRVARGAKSLMTPVLGTTLEGRALRRVRAPGPVARGDVLFEIVRTREVPHPSSISATGTPAGASPLSGLHAPRAALAAHPGLAGTAASRTVVQLPRGLHARPAAWVAQTSKRFLADVTIVAGGRTADARSVVGLMSLGLRYGDEIDVRGEGADAASAVAGIIAALREAASRETNGAASPQGPSAEGPPAEPMARIGPGAAAPHVAAPRSAGASPDFSAARPASSDASAAPGASRPSVTLRGAIAVRGLAVGRAFGLERGELGVEEQGAGAALEADRLQHALRETKARLSRVAGGADASRRGIVEAHLELLDDPQLARAAAAAIAEGKSAGFAWRSALRASVAALRGLGDARLRERADDLLDVEGLVLLALAGEARPLTVPLPEDSILVAHELLPSELTSLDRRHLAGIALAQGGATSHVAILAAAMGIPMLIGLGEAAGSIAKGAPLILDAEAGMLVADPSDGAIEQARTQLAARLVEGARIRSEAQAPCVTADGVRIEVFANIGGGSDAVAAMENGAEGVGLLRTEFLFLERSHPPTEAEQWAAYQGIAATLGGRPLVLRLMDVGGDKPLAYLPLPPEDNPALGLRGVRTLLAHTEILDAQLRAALRIEPPEALRLLVPMVTDVAEMRAVRERSQALAAALGRSPRIEIGAMIETPAAALTAAALLCEADFVSIGTNDLTQYTLAMDRGHPSLAGRTDALHPAVLRLIAGIAEAGRRAGKPVAVCGGIAGDANAVPLLVGLGATELSLVPALIPGVKAQIRRWRMEDCRALAERCLASVSAGDVRRIVTEAQSGRRPA